MSVSEMYLQVFMNVVINCEKHVQFLYSKNIYGADFSTEVIKHFSTVCIKCKQSLR
jgi:hypothetical protein